VVKIVVDSTADLSPEIAAELDISVVPCLIRFGDQTFREGADMSRAEFYARLQTDPHFPGTATPAPGVFAETYRRLAAEADAIVSIHLSANYSGIFGAARLGAEAVAGSQRVVPVDSGQISLGMGLMAVLAAQAARAGASLEEIVGLLEDLKPRTHLFALLDTLDSVTRGGRINPLVARVGAMLRIKPILYIHQGQILLHDRPRSWERAQQHLVASVRALAPVEHAALLHTQRPEAAAALSQALGDLLPSDTFTLEAGVTIGAHAGKRAVGVALVCASNRL
jgi:DegV family protein with EDD domain